MRSRPLVALLSLLPLSTLYGQTPQLPDSLQVDSLPVITEHILAPESVSSKALARIDSLAEAGLRMELILGVRSLPSTKVRCL